VEKLFKNKFTMHLCVDGYNQETLGKYRAGAKYHILHRNLKTIGESEKNAFLILRVLMFRHNDGHKPEFRKLAHLAECQQIRWVRPIILNKAVLSLTEAKEWMSINPTNQRYYLQDGTYHIKNNQVCKPHFVVAVNGEVAACGLDWNLDYSLGNVFKDSWNIIESRLQTHKPKMVTKKLPICRQCYCFSEEPLYVWEKVR
jgi:radical SAM protein with 4Fe4S-binding SPASM domain